MDINNTLFKKNTELQFMSMKVIMFSCMLVCMEISNVTNMFSHSFTCNTGNYMSGLTVVNSINLNPLSGIRGLYKCSRLYVGTLNHKGSYQVFASLRNQADLEFWLG